MKKTFVVVLLCLVTAFKVKAQAPIISTNKINYTLGLNQIISPIVIKNIGWDIPKEIYGVSSFGKE
ncbi:MAG: hypothetical protein K2Q03_04130 [Sphingobacteriaceae bacterium]|nr:hypothetical protein [Sphingobacteriaceae bacterium]